MNITDIINNDSSINKDIQFNVWFPCNMKCTFCCEHFNADREKTDFAVIDKLLQEARNVKVNSGDVITFDTTEWTVGKTYEHFKKIVTYFKDMNNGCRIFLYTNGLNLKNIDIQFLLDNDVKIILAVDTYDGKERVLRNGIPVFDLVVGRTANLIKEYPKLKSLIEFRLVITKTNVFSVKETVNRIVSKTGIKLFSFNPDSNVTQANTKPQVYNETVKETMSIIKFLKDENIEVSYACHHTLGTKIGDYVEWYNITDYPTGTYPNSILRLKRCFETQVSSREYHNNIKVFVNDIDISRLVKLSLHGRGDFLTIKFLTGSFLLKYFMDNTSVYTIKTPINTVQFKINFESWMCNNLESGVSLLKTKYKEVSLNEQ